MGKFVVFCPHLGPHKCPADGQRLRLVATHSCCHYYECINGNLKEKVCPLHKLYDVETKTCENFQFVNCGSRKNCVGSCKNWLLFAYPSFRDFSINLGDYDYSPTCGFTPDCRDTPNGNYVDQYRPNCQFYYTCLENRTYNYTAGEHGHRFSVQHQRCLPAKQVKCSGTILNSFFLFPFEVVFSLSMWFLR